MYSNRCSSAGISTNHNNGQHLAGGLYWETDKKGHYIKPQTKTAQITSKCPSACQCKTICILIGKTQNDTSALGIRSIVGCPLDTYFDTVHLCRVYAISAFEHRRVDSLPNRCSCPHRWPNIRPHPFSPTIEPVLKKVVTFLVIFSSFTSRNENNNNNCASFAHPNSSSQPFAAPPRLHSFPSPRL